MATNNNFTVTGFVAMDANVVKNPNGSAFARFPLSIRTTKKDKDGNEKKISALQNIEVGTKADSPKLDLLKKGTLVKVEGFFEVNQYVGKDEKEHQTIGAWQMSGSSFCGLRLGRCRQREPGTIT